MVSHIYSYFLSFIIFTTLSFPLNLTLTDYHDPVANHMLDVEVVGDILIVSAMIQGIEVYDISNPENLNHLTNFTLSSGGGGGGTKANCVRAIGNYAYFTSSNGLYVVNISNPNNPVNLGSISGTSNLILENLDLEENILAVCAHTDGVLLYDISDPVNPSYTATIDADNAWAVVISGGFIYIANNNKILIADISDVNNPTQIGSIETSNAVKDIAVTDEYMYVALGSDGVDIFNLNDPQSPQLLDNYNTNTMANRISTFDGKVAVSDWDDVDVLQWSGSSLDRVGFKNTGNRTMAIATHDNYIYSAEWASIQAFEFGEISGPDIDLSTLELNYPYVHSGENFSLSVEVTNNGNSQLSIIDDYTTNSHFQVMTGLNDILPGESQVIDIIYNASDLNSAGVYRIYTDDSDESLVMCETNGNIDGANIGELAPDFELDYVANGSGNFKLSDHVGNIIVLAFFAPN